MEDALVKWQKLSTVNNKKVYLISCQPKFQLFLEACHTYFNFFISLKLERHTNTVVGMKSTMSPKYLSITYMHFKWDTISCVLLAYLNCLFSPSVIHDHPVYVCDTHILHQDNSWRDFSDAGDMLILQWIMKNHDFSDWLNLNTNWIC